ncbi:MAG: ornithine carbamoyltransferase [Rhodobacteraceae bacterium]|nr:ornithine carbamoyltransferase [Paracoccaceae bacterium]
MPDFLELSDIDSGVLRQILEQARSMKDARAGRPRGMPDDVQPLGGAVAALIFEKPSTRTRLSFDVGVRQLGGQPIVLSGQDLQIGRGESIGDTAKVMSRYADMAMIRTFGAETVQEFASNSDIPVINGLTDSSHPCQIMADVMTFEEIVGPIEGRRVVWLGAGSNVCNSFVEAAGQFGFDLVFSGPEQMKPDAPCMKFARSKGRSVEVETDPVAAVAGADLIVTDAWHSMHDDPGTKEKSQGLLGRYQVNERLMEAAGKKAIFMHCLPAHRGEEVTSEVIDGNRSAVFDEAENRLHVQKAIMRWCLNL